MPTLTIHPVAAMGAEDVVVASTGHVFTGTEDGRVWRLSPDGAHVDLLGTRAGDRSGSSCTATTCWSATPAEVCSSCR